jgi:hypothetical protein
LCAFVGGRQALANQLLLSDPGAAQVPLHLRALRKAAVAALHTFNHAQALRHEAGDDAAAAAVASDGAAALAGGKGGRGAVAEASGSRAGQPRGASGSAAAGGRALSPGRAAGVAGGAAVGLELASALNGLELELVAAQRARQRAAAEARLAGREKRRRAEARRRAHDAALQAAHAGAAAAAAHEAAARQRVAALTEAGDQSAASAAAAATVSFTNKPTKNASLCVVLLAVRFARLWKYGNVCGVLLRVPGCIIIHTPLRSATQRRQTWWRVARPRSRQRLGHARWLAN